MCRTRYGYSKVVAQDQPWVVRGLYLEPAAMEGERYQQAVMSAGDQGTDTEYGVVVNQALIREYSVEGEG
jgi:hypothetical protein